MTSTGPESDCRSAIQRRRARNRVSQKSFRERQKVYVQQLEEQLRKSSSNQTDEVRELQEECARLRRSLLLTRKRILGLTTALTGVSDRIGEDLGLNGIDVGDECGLGTSMVVNGDIIDPSGPKKNAMAEPKRSAHPSPPRTQIDTGLVTCFDAETHAAMAVGSVEIPTTHEHLLQLLSLSECPSFQQSPTGMNGLYPMLTSPASTTAFRSTLTEAAGTFPSVFSTHLSICEYYLVRNPVFKRRHSPEGSEALDKLIATMVNLWLDSAWPEMCTWWAYIQASAVVARLTRWKIDPNMTTYSALAECHKPTVLQLSVPHPANIDWIWIPSLRDRLIELYASCWILDQITCDITEAYVVETDISRVLSDVGDKHTPVKGYFRIWDLVRAIDREESNHAVLPHDGSNWGVEEDEDDDDDPEVGLLEAAEDEGQRAQWVPMPLEQIFQSRNTAFQLFKLLQVDKRQNIRLHPSFIAKYPELCTDLDVLASGVDCTLSDPEPIPGPRPLTKETILKYKLMLSRVVLS